MIRRFIGIAALVAAVTLPVVAQAQGVPVRVERGSRDGERAAGPVGAVVGGVIGGVVGGVAGVLGVDERPRFRSYVVEPRRHRIVESGEEGGCSIDRVEWGPSVRMAAIVFNPMASGS